MRSHLLALAAVFGFLVAPVPPLCAHPVPKKQYDRVIVVRLTAEAVLVEYHLELDVDTAVNDLTSADLLTADQLAELTNREKVFSAYTRLYGPIYAQIIDASLDKEPLSLKCVKQQYQVKDSFQCDFVFRADWKPKPGQRHTFSFKEVNYEHDAGLIELSLRADSPITLLAKTEPDEALKKRPLIDLRPGDERRRREVTATFELHEGSGTAPTPGETTTGARELPPPRTLLDLLLSSELGIVTLLALATVFGAAHALTPGHGKTLVAAYLVGERGTVWHAVLLGLTTTLSHTGAVWILAVVLTVFFPDADPGRVNTILGFVGGLLVAGLGVWLLLRRLAGGADHFHFGGHGHHHHHGDHQHHDGPANHYHDEHGHVHALPPPGLWGLIIVGIQGGIVPCWDAIFMFGFAVAAGRLWLAVPLLLAFSAGLAGVLVLVGILVVKARGFAGSRWGESRWFRALPVVSAVVITCLGLWLCYNSLHSSDMPPPAATSHG
jgi:ABC-type nickel/cobalt efflux system permease component RcnA